MKPNLQGVMFQTTGICIRTSVTTWNLSSQLFFAWKLLRLSSKYNFSLISLSFCQPETRHKVTNVTETCECRSKSYCEPLKRFVRQCIWNNQGTWVGQHSKLPHGYQRLYSPSSIHRAELIICAFQKLILFYNLFIPSPTTPTWTCKFYQSFFWI